MSDNLVNQEINNKASKKYTVYRHIAPNGKCYVGISSNIKKRWENKGYGYSTQIKFYRAIKKYGWDNFIYEIILTDLSLEEAYKWEKYYILKYNSVINGYNSDYGGAGAEGHTVSLESRQKMREKALGRKSKKKGRSMPMIDVYVYDINGNCIFKEKGYRKISELLNVKRSTLINACNGHFLVNNKYVILNSKNISLLDQILQLINTNAKLIGKPKVFQFTLDGTFVKSYHSYSAASKESKCMLSSIYRSCKGEQLRVDQYFFLLTDNKNEITKRIILIKNNTNDHAKSRKLYKNMLLKDDGLIIKKD